ncbi:PucR family transcriptional regulator [Virgibacillus sp. JSM 102003]|uniref:PucR family transcriptional regulator n=1 Tax=Virgibacillus sp. JSM 102003 TaxID=1562108 RepID=UPI0035BEED5E
MIEQLRKIFSSLVLYNEISNKNRYNYKWFMTNEKQVIGINQKELTEKDTTLLHIFLRPYNVSIPQMTAEEQQWKSYISTDITDSTSSLTYRFIYFSFQPFQIEPESFKEAINEFYARQVPVLFENDHEGIIVETNPKDTISYEQIIDVLMSDLYVKIKFFVGPYLHTLSAAKRYHQILVNGANTTFAYSDKTVSTYIDAVPFILVDQMGSNTRADIINSVLGETEHDKDLLKTIEMFIACNLNVSVTAKELYMHRNSLQYRLDKFTEKTGIDIRQFHQAMAVQLAITINKKLMKET